MTGVESLYPFLYPGAEEDGPASRTAVDSVLAQVARSTRDKVAEIDRVRAALIGTDAGRMAACATAMAERFAAGGRLFSFGNGGSSTDAEAVAGQFLAPAGSARPLPAMALTRDVATLTALANDVSFEVVFARPLAANGRPTDIAFGLSTSGGSRNVLRAFVEARRVGMLTVGLAGYSGGTMAEAAARGEINHLFVMPSDSVHRIQEAQTTTYHVLWELVQLALVGR
ncbi:MAG TPA: SIS domain-containing protein [Pseudonocardia sp.]|uniref:D-sedoheptulose-7-phosphate isomerase n=1 Tax=Pseudonocardia sp. TaxID=60912 RepID=UPI002CB3ACDC|nr:SIS domain-containing protein [Pseudonocardia sp.]HTF46991.1 SIS domain-containing protein [Pseudonocardia sp.]